MKSTKAQKDIRFHGNLLQQLRESTGLYRHEVETEIRLTRGIIALWETGRRRPNRASIAKLCAFFNVDADVFSDTAFDTAFQTKAETELRAMFWKYLRKDTLPEHKFALKIYETVSKQNMTRTETDSNDLSELAESVGHLVRGLVRSGHVQVKEV